MTLNTTLIILYLVFLGPGKVLSQENSDPFLIGYNNKEYLYFDSLHKLKHTELECLNKSYDFYIAFKVDTQGIVIDFEIIEVPGAEIPETAISYIEKLVKSTDRKWQPQIKNYEKVISDEMIYQGILVKKDQSIENRIKDSEPITEYFFGSHTLNKKIEQFIVSKKKRYLLLSY